jgi:hypothetical protein
VCILEQSRQSVVWVLVLELRELQKVLEKLLLRSPLEGSHLVPMRGLLLLQSAASPL